MEVKTKTEAPAEITVSDADVVSLTVIIGNAKMGGSLVRFTDDQKVLGQGDINHLDLGIGTTLKGRTLAVTTNILDSNTAPKMRASHQFTNATPGTFNLSDKVKATGDVFSWEATYIFK